VRERSGAPAQQTPKTGPSVRAPLSRRCHHSRHQKLLEAALAKAKVLEAALV